MKTSTIIILVIIILAFLYYRMKEGQMKLAQNIVNTISNIPPPTVNNTNQ